MAFAVLLMVQGMGRGVLWGVYWDYISVILGLCWGYIGVMFCKGDVTVADLGILSGQKAVNHEQSCSALRHAALLSLKPLHPKPK